MYVCIYSENQTTPKTFTALEAYSWHSFVFPLPVACPSTFPLLLPFSVISQIESNDVPSMSKIHFHSVCLVTFMHEKHSQCCWEGSVCVPGWVDKSTFFAALSDFGTLEKINKTNAETAIYLRQKLINYFVYYWNQLMGNDGACPWLVHQNYAKANRQCHTHNSSTAFGTQTSWSASS